MYCNACCTCVRKMKNGFSDVADRLYSQVPASCDLQDMDGFFYTMDIYALECNLKSLEVATVGH